MLATQLAFDNRKRPPDAQRRQKGREHIQQQRYAVQPDMVTDVQRFHPRLIDLELQQIPDARRIRSLCRIEPEPQRQAQDEGAHAEQQRYSPDIPFVLMQHYHQRPQRRQKYCYG